MHEIINRFLFQFYRELQIGLKNRLITIVINIGAHG